jgi:pimeloyl-ACP methyl ester carboxylesterase
MLTSHLHPIQTHQWQWQGYQIRYQTAGKQGVPILCIHGFGASADHWRKNLPELASNHRVYALDLIGFGFSDKPKPGQDIDYTFETWGQQIVDFCREVIGQPTFLVGNSIGCIAVLQAAVISPDWVRGVAILNCSLRLLHERKRSQIGWIQRTFSPWLQKVLSIRSIGAFFFNQIANPKTIRKVLLQAYGRKAAVTSELVELLLKPAQTPGAADVFLAFIQYSHGPLAEDLLPQVHCPVLCLWGEQDPWEPIALGKAFQDFPTVEDFIPLPGLGHCPQDEAPEEINPLLKTWIAKKTELSQ